MLSFKNVTKVFYPGTADEKIALDNVSFTVNDGEFVTIIGGNGSGKSTTLNVLTGSLNPDKGGVLLNNVDITNMPENKRAKYFARVFQDPMRGTAGSMQVIENLAIASRKGGHNGLGWYINKEKKEQFKKMLADLNLGLEDRLTTKTEVLSGGQRQALTLLMATLRAEPSYRQIVKDYTRFCMGDKEKAKQEVTTVYEEGKKKLKAQIISLLKQKMSMKERHHKIKETKAEFDREIRRFDLTKQILLLDEHTAALDPKTAKKVLALTEKIVRENQLTTLMVTHNMRDAITYGDRLIMFYNGHIIHDFKGEEKKKLTVEKLLKLFDDAEANS